MLAIRELVRRGLAARELVERLQETQRFRNELVHGEANPIGGELLKMIAEVENLTEAIEQFSEGQD